MISAHCVIIGAGFAGAATAYHLARRGVRDILILEQERVAGAHSSGRNAAMVRQVVPEPTLMPLTRDGAAFIRNLPSDWPIPTSFQQNGSLLLASEEGLKKLLRDAGTAQELGIEVEFWSREVAEKRVPVLKEAEFEGAVWSPTDGVVDIHALIDGYLKAAMSRGVIIRYGSPVQSINVRQDRVVAVATTDDVITTEVVVNAAGPWAAMIGTRAGASDVPLRACRRHLVFTPPLPWVDQKWPFVWNVSHDVYFRPESGGLLLSPCDQDEMSPGVPPTDNSITELLADKVKRCLPGISNIAIKGSSAGFRTLSADGRFVIGWDPKVEGFFWVAGLGGHGVTTSSSVGALAADLILVPDSGSGEEFSPKRFAT